MVTIVPAIIPYSYEELADALKRVRKVVPRVQIDVVDGAYASPSSWPYNNVDRDAFDALCSGETGFPLWEEYEFEVDLMVRTPEEKIDHWIAAGAATIIIHLESTDAITAIFACAQDRVEIAVALKPSTDIALLAPWIDRVAFVQVMGSDTIGRHGSALDPRVPWVIGDIKKRYPHGTVGVDIGVTEATISSLADAGATRFAVGSFIWDAPSAPDAIATLMHAAE